MRKLFITVLAVALGAALVYGATMAWFTDSDTVADTEFKAGTLVLNAAEPDVRGLALATKGVVNPGDKFDCYYTFKNDGSKELVLRVIPDFDLQLATGKTLPTGHSPLYIIKSTLFGYDETSGDWYDKDPGDSWEVLNDIAAPTGVNNYGLALLYKAPLKGTDEGTGSDTVTLGIQIEFQGKYMNNAYQGCTFTLGGVVQSIQASHNTEWSWADFATYNP
jgi:predicted ribosomally synthesized peptide with SipW-like signal peptide